MVEDEAGKIEPRRRYVSKFLLTDWREQLPEQTPERRAFFRELVPRGVTMLREMHEAGVRILPGSDTAVLGVFPGSSLHEELALFVSELGLTPAQALERATRMSAEFLGLGDSLGSIAPGKLADLVLLGADPLAEIQNLRRVEAVFLGGRLFTRADLDMLLAAVEAAPDRQRNDWPR
jgi:imidazolonepropionase-like amidohydrolase